MVEYLNSLSHKEIIKLEKFIYSPYFTTQKNIVRLFNYIRRLYPEIKEEDLSKKNIASNVLMEEEINDVKIRKLTSEFMLLLEQFFIHLENDEDDLRNRILLLRSLRKRGFSKRFELNYKHILKLLNNSFSKDEDYYRNKINLANELFYYRFGNPKWDYKKELREKSNSLDYYFLFAKLHTLNEMHPEESPQIKDRFYEENYFKDLVEQVKKKKKEISKKHPNLLIIFYSVMMFRTREDKYLHELLDFLKLNEKKFTLENLSYYYHYVTQYYIMKINSGKTEYRPKAFEVYKIMDKKNLFLIDNIIAHTEFNSVVNISIGLKEYEWLEVFLEKYRKYIDPGFAKDIYNLACAKLYFQRKKYDELFKYLINVEFKDPVYYYNAKFILGRVYYEQKNINGARYIISNLRQYMRTKKSLTSEQINAIMVFNHYMGQLVKVFECNSKEVGSLKVVLKKELDNEEKLVPNKDWFYESLSNIK